MTATAVPSATFASFIVDPTANGVAHEAVSAAVQACADGQRAGALLLLGGPASGKSHLLGAVTAALTPILGSHLLCYTAEEFVTLCEAAHYASDPSVVQRLALAGRDLGMLRRGWSRARAVLLDDLCRLAGHPAAERELCAILAAASLSGALVLLAGRTATEALASWARPTLAALARCRRVVLRPVGAGHAGQGRTALVAAALAARGLALPDAVLAQVAGLPLAPEPLAVLVQDVWSRPGLDNARRLGQLHAAYQARLRESVRAGEPSPAEVIEAVATACGTTAPAVLGASRELPVARARQIAMYLLCVEYDLTSIAVAAVLGRDHSTVLHGRDRVARLIATDPAVADLVAAVRAELAGRPHHSRIILEADTGSVQAARAG